MRRSPIVVALVASCAFGGGVGSLLTAAAESTATPAAHIASQAQCEHLVTNVGKAFVIVGTALKDAGGYAALIEPAAKAGIAGSASQIDAVAAKESAITAKINALNSQLTSVKTSIFSAEAGCLG
jgi:hypothetical protein